VRIPLWGKRKQPLQTAKAVKSEYNKDYLFENCESVKKTASANCKGCKKRV